MRAVLLSIKPKWCELIIQGKKTIEIRKTKPKIDLPFKCYIYCTQGSSKDLSTISQDIYEKRMQVIGEFVCDELIPINVFENGSIQNYICYSMERSCVPYDDIANYIGNGCCGCGWHISDLIIYDEPKDLSEFKPPCDGFDKRCQVSCALITIDGKSRCTRRQIIRPPQSYMFVESLEEI